MAYIQYDTIDEILRNDDLEAFKNMDFYSHPDALYFTESPECEYINQALQSKSVNIVGYLLGKHKCPVAKNSLNIAVLKDDLEMVKLLLEFLQNDELVQTGFQLAAQRNNVPILQYFVERGISPCISNGAVLSSAAAKGSIEAAKFLIEQGCDPAINDNAIINVASRFKQDKMVEFLLQYDSVVQAPNILSKLSDKHKDLFLQKTLIGPTMALHDLAIDRGGEGVRLPIHIVNEILNHAYAVDGSLGLVDVIDRIQSVYDVKK